MTEFEDLKKAKKEFDEQIKKTMASSEAVKDMIEGICELCGGEGSYTLPAEQVAGEIRDEQTITCRCKK